jgi:PAS domain-containing protein
MPQKEIEMILARQLASYLAMPIFIVDPQGTLVYYNEPAERVLGNLFESAGEMPLPLWASAFDPVDENGQHIPAESLPLAIALSQGRPAHSHFWIHGHDGVRRHIEVTAFPLTGQAERGLGAVAIFWEAPV